MLLPRLHKCCYVVIAMLVMMTFMGLNAHAAESVQPTAGHPIRFKSDMRTVESDGIRSLLTLGVILVLAIPALYVLKKRYPILGRQSGSESRIKILESKTVARQLMLHRVEINGEEIVLAQSGDKVKQISLSTRPEVKRASN